MKSGGGTPPRMSVSPDRPPEGEEGRSTDSPDHGAVHWRSHALRANQLRLWFASMAYVLLAALRRIALANTRLARATCGSIRLKLLKIGAQVRLSARRIRIAMATGAPHAPEFARAHARLCA